MAAAPGKVERRAAAEMRAAGSRLVGYAAVFDEPARIGTFSEVIRPGAFTATLAEACDVLALVDHDPGRLLARTGSGTLWLAEDARGLAFEIDIPDTQLGRDVRTLAERRDIGGASIGFRATVEKWPAAGRRELLAVDLVELSVVHAFPAYGGTVVNFRAAADRLSAARRRRFVAAL